MTKEQEREIVEILNDITVAVQLLASRLGYEAGQDAEEARLLCATANKRLFDIFPEYRNA